MKTNLNIFNFKGHKVTFPVGANNDRLSIVLTHDDGTSGNYLIIEFNEVPYASLPIVNKEGLGKLIDNLKYLYEKGFDEKK